MLTHTIQQGLKHLRDICIVWKHKKWFHMTQINNYLENNKLPFPVGSTARARTRAQDLVHDSTFLWIQILRDSNPLQESSLVWDSNWLMYLSLYGARNHLQDIYYMDSNHLWDANHTCLHPNSTLHKHLNGEVHHQG